MNAKTYDPADYSAPDSGAVYRALEDGPKSTGQLANRFGPFVFNTLFGLQRAGSIEPCSVELYGIQLSGWKIVPRLADRSPFHKRIVTKIGDGQDRRRG